MEKINNNILEKLILGIRTPKKTINDNIVLNCYTGGALVQISENNETDEAGNKINEPSPNNDSNDNEDENKDDDFNDSVPSGSYSYDSKSLNPVDNLGMLEKRLNFQKNLNLNPILKNQDYMLEQRQIHRITQRYN